MNPEGSPMSMPATAEQSSGAVRRAVKICNQKGLHARAAARFVKTASQFAADVTVRKNGTSVSGRSIMDQGRVEIIAGVNLPMLIKLASVRDAESLEEAVASAQEAGRKYINVASTLLNVDRSDARK